MSKVVQGARISEEDRDWICENKLNMSGIISDLVAEMRAGTQIIDLDDLRIRWTKSKPGYRLRIDKERPVKTLRRGLDAFFGNE